LKRRKDLKLIVTSATLDAEKFSTYFGGCPIFTIPGRTFPVEVLYTKEPESDYLDAALITIMQIHLSEPPGDILLFLTGAEEIDTSCEILHERMKALGPQVPELIVLPVYSALPSEMQSRIFDPAPPGARKCVIATNIAETSITIDGIFYVIDPGFVKQNAYDPRLGMDSLVVVPISQAQARQRAGRAGRTGPGKTYRLYTEAAYRNEMLPNPIPDIQRQNLSHTILMLKAMGINDLLNFGFMDPPPQQTLVTALEGLYALSALDDEGLLTRLGRKMADCESWPRTRTRKLTLLSPYGAASCQDADRLGRAGLLGRDPIYCRHADSRQHMVPAEGQASASRREEGQVPRGGGRPPDPAERLQRMEEQRVQQPVVPRELRAGAELAASPGRAEAAVGHHGAVQARYCVVRPQHESGATGHHIGLLPARGQEGPARGLQDARRRDASLCSPLFFAFQSAAVRHKCLTLLTLNCSAENGSSTTSWS
jgi:hypothetical protein